MNWKNLLESVSESVNDELRLRHDYLVAENRILHNQIDGRVQLSDAERRELAGIGIKLGKPALAEIATIAQADTILAWHRKFANLTVNSSAPPKSVGRPRVAPEIEEWVIRMARENRSWGYDRIQGSLNHLGYTISDQTVGNILKRHGIPPAPERKRTITWGEFVRPHLAGVLLANGDLIEMTERVLEAQGFSRSANIVIIGRMPTVCWSKGGIMRRTIPPSIPFPITSMTGRKPMLRVIRQRLVLRSSKASWKK